MLDRPSQGPQVRGTAQDNYAGQAKRKDRGPGTVDRVLDRPSQGPQVRGKAKDNYEILPQILIHPKQKFLDKSFEIRFIFTHFVIQSTFYYKKNLGV